MLAPRISASTRRCSRPSTRTVALLHRFRRSRHLPPSGRLPREDTFSTGPCFRGLSAQRQDRSDRPVHERQRLARVARRGDRDGGSATRGLSRVAGDRDRGVLRESLHAHSCAGRPRHRGRQHGRPARRRLVDSADLGFHAFAYPSEGRVRHDPDCGPGRSGNQRLSWSDGSLWYGDRSLGHIRPRVGGMVARRCDGRADSDPLALTLFGRRINSRQAAELGACSQAWQSQGCSCSIRVGASTAGQCWRPP